MRSSRLECTNHTLFQTKMVEIDTLFQTKTVEKPYLCCGTYLRTLYKGLPSGAKNVLQIMSLAAYASETNNHHNHNSPQLHPQWHCHMQFLFQWSCLHLAVKNNNIISCQVWLSYMPTFPDTTTISSSTGHQISWIKSSYDLFCALIWNLSYFLQKFKFPFNSKFDFWGIFARILSLTKILSPWQS